MDTDLYAKIVERWSEFYLYSEISEEFGVSDGLITKARKIIGEAYSRPVEERANANDLIILILESIANKSYTKAKHIEQDMVAKGHSTTKRRGYLRRLKDEDIISQDGNFYELTDVGNSCLQCHYETLLDEILVENKIKVS